MSGAWSRVRSGWVRGVAFGLVLVLVVSVVVVGSMAVPAVAQTPPRPTELVGSTSWQRGPQLCGGTLTLAADDWKKGEPLVADPGDVGRNTRYGVYGYVYFPSGPVTSVVTTKVWASTGTGGGGITANVQVRLRKADVEPYSPPGHDTMVISNVGAGLLDMTKGVADGLFDAVVTEVNTLDEPSDPAGWYRLQVDAVFTDNVVTDGSVAPPAWEVTVAYSGNRDCDKDALEMACVCNPGSGLVMDGTASEGNPVTTGFGNKLESFTDLSVQSRGGALGVSRSYNSLLAGEESKFGYGWTWSWGSKLTFGSPFAGDVKVVQASGAPVVFSPTVVSSGATRYVGAPWVLSTLSLNASTGNYEFRLKDGTTFVYGPQNADVAVSGRLLSVTNPNGYQTTLTYSTGSAKELTTVTDAASGRTLTIGWNAAKTLVTSVSDQAVPPRSVTYTYDANHNLTDVVDVAGNKMIFGYDSSHRLTHKRYPKQANLSPQDTTHDVVNTYQGARVTSQTDNRLSPARVTTFDYSPSGLPAQDESDPNGATKITVKAAGSSTVDYTRVDHYSHGQRTRIDEGTGAEQTSRQFTYDKQTGGLRSVQVLTAAPSTWATVATYRYDWLGNMVTSADGLGRTTTFTYDARGDVLTARDAAGVITTNTYDAFGNLTSSCTPVQDNPPAPGTVVDCTSSAVDAMTTLGYDPAKPGDLVWIRDPDHQDASPAGEANSTRVEYDPATGQQTAVLQIKTPEAVTGGNRTTFEYDEVGRLKSMVAPKGNETPAATDFMTSFVPNAYGDVVQITDPLNRVTKRRFDANHNLEWTQPGDGNCESTPKVKCTTYTYNTADQLDSTNLPETGTAQANTYWPTGALKTQTDGGVTTSYGYDSAGRLKSITAPKPAPADPDRVTIYGYDPYGRLWTRQDPGGNCSATPKIGCVTYGYNAASQPITVDYSDAGTHDVSSITYDAVGRRTAVSTTEPATSSYGWDTLGRMRSSSENGSAVTYAWTPGGNNTKIGYPGGDCTVTPAVRCAVYEYDNANRMKSVTDWVGRKTTFTPDEHGNTATIGYPGATAAEQTSDTFSFDDADQLMSIGYKKNTTTIATETYERLAAGQLSSDVQTGFAAAPEGNTRKFGYDANNRLCWTATTAGTSPTCAAPPSGAKTWNYDNAANMTKTASNLYMRTDGANQLCYSNDVFGDNSAACGSQNPTTATTYQYDNRGNRTGTTPPPFESIPSTYSYDQQNRLTQAVVPTSAWNEGEYSTLATPARIADTHTGSPVCPGGVCAQVAAGATIEVTVGGASGVPTSSVSAVSIDLSADRGTAAGFLTAYSSDLNAVPATSNLNYTAGQKVTNGAIVKVGSNNKIKITNTSTGTVDVVVDVQGWFATWSGAAGGTFTPLDPARITASSGVTVGANSAVDVTVAGAGGIPTTGVAAVTANLTVSAGTVAGEMVAYSTGLANPPGTTSAAFGANKLVAALAIVKVGADGKIRLYNRSDQAVTAFVDVSGWTATTASAAQSDFMTTTPTRIPAQTLSGFASVPVQITGVAGVPANATAVSATITASGATGQGGVQAWANGGPSPQTLTLVYDSTGPSANGAVVKIGTDGKINLRAYGPDVSVTVDITGYYQPSSRTTTYTYNADGTRKTRTTGGIPAQFHWTHHQGLPMLLTETIGGVGSVNIIYGPGGLPVEQLADDGTNPVFLHHDQQGSTRLATNEVGATVATWTYDPYGKIVGATGNYLATHMLYTGQYWDWETGFYNLRARLYDPTTGQFLTRDPIVSITRSAYGYVYADPLNLVDPSGLCGWTDPWDCVVPDDMSGVGNVVRPVRNTVGGVNGVGALVALAGGADCRFREGRMLCTGGYWPFSDAVTIGDVIIADGEEITDDVFRHEANHSNQWAFWSWGFVPAYIVDWGIHGFNADCMWFEQAAGTEGMSYKCGGDTALGLLC